MTVKKQPALKPSLTDAERHERFKDMAKEIEADESPSSFERAFTKVVTPPKPKP